MGTTEFKQISWLPVEHRVTQIKLNLVYRIVNMFSSRILIQNDFNQVSQVHRYSTCHSVSSLYIPSVKNAEKTTFIYSALKLWNELPKKIKFVTKEHKFKGADKTIYLIKCNRVISLIFFVF